MKDVNSVDIFTKINKSNIHRFSILGLRRQAGHDASLSHGTNPHIHTNPHPHTHMLALTHSNTHSDAPSHARQLRDANQPTTHVFGLGEKTKAP